MFDMAMIDNFWRVTFIACISKARLQIYQGILFVSKTEKLPFKILTIILLVETILCYMIATIVTTKYEKGRNSRVSFVTACLALVTDFVMASCSYLQMVNFNLYLSLYQNLFAYMLYFTTAFIIIIDLGKSDLLTNNRKAFGIAICFVIFACQLTEIVLATLVFYPAASIFWPKDSKTPTYEYILMLSLISALLTIIQLYSLYKIVK